MSAPNRPLLKAFAYASRGLGLAWRRELNFRIEVILGGVAILLAWWLDSGLILVVVLIGLVLGLELVNTALETTLDLLHPDHHEGVRAAKDLAGAAVLLASLVALVVGILLFGPPLLHKLAP